MVGGAVALVAVCDGDFGSGASLTSLGTTMPFFVSGAAGKPASGDDAALAGVCGGGSAGAFGPQVDAITVLRAKIKQRPIDFIAIPAS
jgi:hypothetical protein